MVKHKKKIQKKQQKHHDNDNDIDIQQNSNISQNQEDGILGEIYQKLDYINIRKTKPKPSNNIECNQKSVLLLRRQQLYQYLDQIQLSKKQTFANHIKSTTQNNKITQKTSSKQSQIKKRIYDQVIHQLRLANNVCLIGGMDKNQILDQVYKLLSANDQYVFSVKGYSNLINEKKIYNSFGNFLISCGFVKCIDQVFIEKQIKQYKQILQKKTTDDTIIYFVFYDLSSFPLLNTEIQQRLSDLLALPRVRVISYIENARIVLHMSFKTISQLNFVYVNCNGLTTPISNQLRYMPVLNERSQKTQMQIVQIWKSLNRNQRLIAKVLATRQLQNLQKNQQNYFTFGELFDSCINEIIISEEYQLKENLIELTDHKVVIEQMDRTKNKKVYIMKLDQRILQNIVQGKYNTYDNQNQI